MKKYVERAGWFCILLLIYLLQYLNWNGMYADTDAYMRALRVLDFISSGQWSEHKFMLTNWPFGEISHWTRLPDLLLSLCAAPFMPFYALKDAVFFGGLLFTPLCIVCALYILQKWGEKQLDFRSRVVLYLLLWVQNIPDGFAFNAPDHHVLLWLATIGLLYELSLFIEKQQTKNIIESALICAIALWVAAEGVFLYVAALAFLFGGYLFFEYPYKAVRQFGMTYALATTFFWLLNPPYEGYLFADNGRLSILYVGGALFAAITLLAAELGKQKAIRVMTCVLSAAFLGAIAMYFGWLQSPIAPNIKEAFIDRVSEMQNAESTAYLFVLPLLALGTLVYLLKFRDNRRYAFLLLCFLCVYIVPAAWAVRFQRYVALLSAMTFALWLARCKTYGFLKFATVTICLCAVNIVSFTLFAILKYDLTKRQTFKTAYYDMDALRNYLLADGAIVADVFVAPMLIWYTGHPTVASPYHRNTEGITDNHRILFSDNMTEVKQLLAKHHVGTILLPQILAADNYFREPEKNCDKLYGMLLGCNTSPDWLEVKSVNKMTIATIKTEDPE